MDFTQIIKAVAPWIGTALTGPLGGMALSAAADALGVPEKTTDALKTVIAGATPEQMLALKKADQDFQVTMQTLGFKEITYLEQIAADDRKDARAREVAVKDGTPARLAYMIIGGFFGIALAQLVALMGWPDVAAKIPPQGWVIIGNISGYLAAEAKAAAAYYFGTTSDSGRKTELLAQAQPIEAGSK
jgi:hypothetical protein